MTRTETVEIALTESQRRALAEHINEKRGLVVFAIALFVFALVVGIGDGVRLPGGAPLPLLLLVLIAAGLVAAAALPAYRMFRFDPRAAQIVKRTTGDLTIETIYHDDDPDFRFIEIDGRKVSVGRAIPDMPVGTIEYTPNRGDIVAVWDREGILAWAAPGYEPFPPDRMRITA